MGTWTHQLAAGKFCLDRNPGSRIELRSGKYWVFYNHIRASQAYACHEAVTYATHGTVAYVKKHLPALVQRWQGPVSISVYAPVSYTHLTLPTIYSV